MTHNPVAQPTEADERRHLELVTDRTHDEAMRFDAIVRRKRGESLAIKKYLNENKAEMDHAEKIDTNQDRQAVYQMVRRHLAEFTDPELADRPLSERSEILLGLRPYPRHS